MLKLMQNFPLLFTLLNVVCIVLKPKRKVRALALVERENAFHDWMSIIISTFVFTNNITT